MISDDSGDSLSKRHFYEIKHFFFFQKLDSEPYTILVSALKSLTALNARPRVILWIIEDSTGLSQHIAGLLRAY